MGPALGEIYESPVMRQYGLANNLSGARAKKRRPRKKPLKAFEIS